MQPDKILPGKLNVLIVGGGIAGLTMAILLRKKNIHAELIERCGAWKPVGGGITLTLNGVKLLADIGLLPEIEKHSCVIKNINIANRHNRMLSTFNVHKYAGSFAKTLTIARSDLHEVLLKNANGTVIHLDRCFQHMEHINGKVKVTFNNGPEQYYDLVIGCDGIHSSVREKMFAGAKLKYSGYACWRFVVDNTTGISNETLTEMWGKGKRFGIVPLPGNKVHCFASVNAPAGYKNFQDIGLPQFKKLFKDFGGAVPALLNSLEEDEHALMYNDLEDIHLNNWQNGRIILIGDAAHGMTPNLTQGASMAIEDACVLAEQLSGSDTVEEALKAFCGQRQNRVRTIQRRSRLLGKIGQVRTGALAGLRNYCWKMIPDAWIQNDFEKLLLTDHS